MNTHVAVHDLSFFFGIHVKYESMALTYCAQNEYYTHPVNFILNEGIHTHMNTHNNILEPFQEKKNRIENLRKCKCGEHLVLFWFILLSFFFSESIENLYLLYKERITMRKRVSKWCKWIAGNSIVLVSRWPMDGASMSIRGQLLCCFRNKNPIFKLETCFFFNKVWYGQNICISSNWPA